MGVLDDALNQWATDTVADQADAKSGKSSTRRELEAGVRDFVGQTAGGLGALTGSDTLTNFADEQSKVSERLRSRSTYVQSFDDVHGAGDLASYIAKFGLESAPTIATMLVGGMGGAGLAARGLSTAERAAAAGRIAAARAGGALATQETSEIGRIAAAQRQQSGEVDIPSAVGLGTASNALNLLGVEGGVVRGLPKSVMANRAGRAVVGGLRVGAEESVASVGQQLAEEVGRRSVDGSYDILNPESQKRLTEAAIGGGLLGGVVGGVHGGVSSAKEPAKAPAPEADPVDITQPEVRQLPAPAAREPGAITGYPSGDLATPETKSAVGDDFFTGATIETLRPADGAASVARAIKAGGTDPAIVHDLANNITKALAVRNVSAADQAILDAEAHVADLKTIKPAQRQQLAKSFSAARDIVSAYRRAHEALAPGRLEQEATPATPDPIPATYDALRELGDLLPEPPPAPKLDDVRKAVGPKSDPLGRKLVAGLHDALSKNDMDGVGQLLNDFAQRVEAGANDTSIKPETVQARQRMLEAAEKVVADHQTLREKYDADSRAYEALLDEATAPPNAPPSVNTLAAKAREVARPGAAVALEPLNNEQSVQQAREQNAAAQNARGTPESGNQSQVRADLLHEAFTSGEKNVRGVFQQLLKAAYPNDKAAHVVTLDEVRQIIKFVNDRRNGDLALKAGEKLSSDLDKAMTPLPETQDTTLGVAEKAAEKGPAGTPKEKPAAPAQGEMFPARQMTPTGRTREARHAKEQLLRKAVTGEVAERPEPQSQGEQLELFKANKKPTVYAEGRSRVTADFRVEEARRKQGKVAKAVMSQLDTLVSGFPEVKPEVVSKIARLVTESKFKEAGTMIDAEKSRLHKLRPPERVELPKDELDARTERSALMRDYENEVGAKALDKIDQLIEKKNFAKATEAIAKERSRIEAMIKKAGVENPVEANNVTPKASKPKAETPYAGNLKRETVERAIDRKFADGSLDVEDGKRMYDVLKENDPVKVKELEAELFPRRKPDVQAKFAEPDRSAEPAFERPASPTPQPPDVDMQAKIAEVEAHVKQITRDWGDAIDFEVMDSQNPVTDEQRSVVDALRDLDGGASGRFKGVYLRPGSTFNKNARPKIMVDAREVTGLSDLKATVYHEALGHYGLQNAYRNRLGKLLYDLYKSNPEIRDSVRERIKTTKGGKMGPLDEILYHTEEYLAEKSEQGALKASWLQRIKDVIQSFARRMGIRKGEFSPEEIAAIVRKGQEFATRGKPTPPNSGFRQRVHLSDETGLHARRVNPDERTPDQRVREAMEKVAAPERAISTAITLNAMRRKAMQGMMFGHDLVDYLAKPRNGQSPLLPSYAEYHNLLQGKQQIVNDYTRKTDQLFVEANQLNDLPGMLAFMRQATMSGKWGYQPKWLTERTPDGKVKPKMVPIDPEQRRLYNELAAREPAAARIADEFFKQGFEAREQLREAVREEREAETADAVKSARNETERREITRQARRAARLFDAKVPSLAGPYIPLSRFGSYVSVGRSAEMAALEDKPDKTAAEKEQLHEMRADPKHFIFSMHTTAGLAEAEMQTYKKLGFDHTYSAPKEEYYRGVNEAPYLQMQRLKQMVHDTLGTSDKFDRSTVRHIDTMLRDLYYSSLAEDSARKHDLRRDNVAGVKDDELLRAIASKQRADAHHLAALTNNSRMNAQLTKMRAEASVKDHRLADRKHGLNEVLARHEQGMQYDETPWQDKATAIASVWYLLTSPRYYIQNSLQTGMVTAPILAGRFGFGKAWSHIFDAYKSLGPILSSKKAFAQGKFDVSQLGLPQEEADFLNAQRKTGLLDIGLNYDMGYWEGGNSAPSKFIAQQVHRLRTVSQQVEVVNRVTAGLAAYRLAKSIGMNAADATAYAQGILAQTHGDYSRTNAPRYLNVLPKVVTQFRKYQLIQMSLLARHAFNAVANANPHEKWVARKTLAYLLGQTAVVTGAFGLPAVQAIAQVMSSIWGDEDEPADGEQYLRKMIGDNDTANLLLKGLPAAMGADLSANIGLGTALSVLPYTDFNVTSRDGLAQLAAGAMGPAFGMAQHMADGMGYLTMGDTQKGIEAMLPTGPRGVLRAYRQATEGITNRAGDALMTPEEITFGEQFLTALGFTPTRMQDQRRVQQVNREYDDYFKGRTTQIKFAYTQAAKAGDTETLATMRDAWQKLQDSKKRVGFKPAPMSDLLTAPARQKRREKNTVGGVQFKSNNQRFIEESLGQ